MSPLLVELHGVVIGELHEEGSSAVFHFYPSYWQQPKRAVLGRWFEDGRPDEAYRGWPGSLPAWFDNLEPEGALSRLLAERHDLGHGILELLGAAGDDLPGALRLRQPDPVERRPLAVITRNPRRGSAFSLSGVQLKFSSKLGKDGRLTLPVSGESGDYILKLPPLGRYKFLVHNEHATMAWAARAGFDVAQATVLAPEQVDIEVVDLTGPALMVSRFDRSALGPIHQEDFAQIGWLEAGQKYPREPGATDDPRRDGETEERRRALTSYEGLAQLVAHLLGERGLEEFIARLVFAVATGNGDAHLKNWSVVYPDRRRPQWSPLYDQVATVVWQHKNLALSLGGRTNFASIHRAAIVSLGTAAGLNAARVESRIDATLAALASTWEGGQGYPIDHAHRLIAHWRGVPLLRQAASLEKPG